MIDVATLEAMLAAGASAEVIVAAVKSELLKAEGNRAKNRDRMRSVRARASTDAHTDAQTPPQGSPSFSPSTPTPITTPSSPPTSSLRSESPESDWPKDSFAQFWALYPRKVGKKAAARRLDSVRRAGEIGWGGLVAAIARIDRKDPQFIPHPSTWLHEGRYLDGIATGPPPTAEPVWMKPPPGAVSYLDKMRTNGNGATLGTEIRNDAGLGKSGPDHPAELPLPGGSSLRRA